MKSRSRYARHALAALRIAALAAILGLVPAFALLKVPAAAEVARASERFEVTRTELAKSTAHLAASEARLTLLTTSVDAVEREARVELQMVKPGERLFLVQTEQ